MISKRVELNIALISIKTLFIFKELETPRCSSKIMPTSCMKSGDVPMIPRLTRPSQMEDIHNVSPRG